MKTLAAEVEPPGWAHKAAERTRAYKKRVASEQQDLYLAYQDEFDRGPLDPVRREACRHDPLLFATTYLSEEFPLPFSDQHRVEAEKLKQAVVDKAWFANADRRGGGKSTRARAFALWGIAYGFCQYIMIITATSDGAKKHQDSLLKRLMYSRTLREDFPELCLGFVFCRGKAQSANHMLWKGEPAECVASTNKLVTPAMDLAYSECTETVLQFTSMQGEIRGNFHTRVTGETIRPDLAIPDDPQTRATARSRAETDMLEETIKGDVAYMNGPNSRIGMIVPCTVVYGNDLADRLLNRKLNPQFHGERTRFMITFPTNLTWWEKYGDLRAEMQMNDRPEKEIDEACNAMYSKEREIADAGAKVSWEHAYTRQEVSAVQHGMNRWLAGPAAFAAEYQNEPVEQTSGDQIVLEARSVAKRQSGLRRGVLPDWTTMLIATADISKPCIWWQLTAFDQHMTAAVVDYGIFPDQKRRYVTRDTIQISMEDYWTQATGRQCSLATAIQMSLDTLVKTFASGDWRTASGRQVNVEAFNVDAGYNESRMIIYTMAKQGEHRALIHPCRGFGTTLQKPSIWNPQTSPRQGERRGHHWRVNPMEDGLQTQIDTNAWKTIVAEAIQVPVAESGAIGGTGALTLFTVDRIADHEMWADQICVEQGERCENPKSGVKMVTWSCPIGSDNHMLDNTVMAFVGASIRGASRTGHKVGPSQRPARRARRSLREIFEANNGGGDGE